MFVIYQKCIVYRNHFTVNKSVHIYDTRQSNDLHIRYIKKSIGQRTVQHTGSILWNSLPPVFKKCMSKNHLKVNLKCICFKNGS